MQEQATDIFALRASHEALSRRVALLEHRLLGSKKSHHSPMTLRVLYTDALCGRITLDDESMNLWVSAIARLDELELLELARDTLNPFPWSVFLRVVDWFLAHGFAMEDSAEHVLSVAQGLLTIQGLGKLHPADVYAEVITPLGSYQSA